MSRSANYTVGDLEISVVSDGEFRLDGGAVFGIIPRTMWEPVVGRENIDEQYRIPMGLNCMVVRSGSEVLVVDTGMGTKLTGVHRERTFPGEYGHLLDELSALGIERGDVTAVANTHLHADHCGWNTMHDASGNVVPTFPNARYFVQRGEYESAMHPNERTRGTYFAENVEPLKAAGLLELVEGETDIIRDARFMPTPGHTPDHASILLQSNGETGIYTGDLVHSPTQAERPVWIAAFDVLPLVTLESKKAFVERAVRENALLICVHNAFPGVGRLTEQNGKRTFVAE